MLKSFSITFLILRVCLDPGVVLLSTTEVTTAPHLVLWFVAGESAAKEKVERIWFLLKGEEKVSLCSGSAKSSPPISNLALTFCFFVAGFKKHMPLHACQVNSKMRSEQQEIPDLVQESIDHLKV